MLRAKPVHIDQHRAGLRGRRGRCCRQLAGDLSHLIGFNFA